MNTDILTAAMRGIRADTFSKSDQLTLGEMIDKCEVILSKGYKLYDGSEPAVEYDFCGMHPTDIDSWRGSYAELALDHQDSGKKLTISEFLSLLKSTAGKEFTGYKGGEFIMTRRTPVWVANYSHSGQTAVIDIIDKDYSIIIVTGYREF